MGPNRLSLLDLSVWSVNRAYNFYGVPFYFDKSCRLVFAESKQRLIAWKVCCMGFFLFSLAITGLGLARFVQLSVDSTNAPAEVRKITLVVGNVEFALPAITVACTVYYMESMVVHTNHSIQYFVTNYYDKDRLRQGSPWARGFILSLIVLSASVPVIQSALTLGFFLRDEHQIYLMWYLFLDPNLLTPFQTKCFIVLVLGFLQFVIFWFAWSLGTGSYALYVLWLEQSMSALQELTGHILHHRNPQRQRPILESTFFSFRDRKSVV